MDYIMSKMSNQQLLSNLQSSLARGVALKKQKEEEERKRKEQEAQGLLGTILGTAGTLIGGMVGGPAGAAIGGSLGGMLSGKDTSSELQKGIGKLDLSSMFKQGGMQ